jgi:hypothetical protein
MKASSKMATSKSTPSATPDERTAAIWVQLDELSAALMSIEALLANTYGDALDSFSRMNDSLRDAYLGHCVELVTAAKNQAISICEEAQVLAQTGTTKPGQAS